MEDFIESYDENDIEDFEEYLHYYGFDDDSFGDNEDDDKDTECEVRELYF